MRKLATLIAVWSFCILPTTTLAKSVNFRIDRVEVDDFVEKSEIRFYIDVLDSEKEVIRELAEEDIAVYVEGESQPLECDITLDSFRDLDEGMAVAIVMAAHNAYVPAAVEEPVEGDGTAEKTPSPFEYQRKGVLRFLNDVGSYDYVGLFVYDEEGYREEFGFSVDIDGVKDAVERLDPRHKETGRRAPKPFTDIKKIIEARMAESEDDLPRRQVLLIMSDGLHGARGSKGVQRAKQTAEEVAEEERVKVYSIGYSLGDTSYLKYLAQLSGATNGVYREVEPGDIENIPEVYAKLVDELRRQYVVTVRSEDIDDGEMLAFRLDVDARGASVTAKTESVRIPDKPFAWGKLLLIIGLVVVGLLVIFLLVKLVQMILRRRAEAADYEPEEYTGPSKGRLIITGGPYAGIEFHLTSETVTIGSMGKNDIALEGDDACSKRHAGIKIDGLRYELADFGSTNGTYVNGRRINKVFLKDGDQVRVGSSEMTFRMK